MLSQVRCGTQQWRELAAAAGPHALPPTTACCCLGPLPQLLKTEFDTARVVYNRFVSAISQKPTIATVLSPDVRRPPARLLPQRPGAADAVEPGPQ